VEAKHRFFRALSPRLHAVPGVVSATAVSSVPPYGGIGTDHDIPGKPQSEQRRAVFQLVSEGYFRTLGLRLIRGRPLSEVDVNDSRRVAVVNLTLVDRFFGSEEPLGQRVNLSFLETLPEHAIPDHVFEIVGVITDARNQGIQEPPMPEALIPYGTTGAFERGILLRTAGDPDMLLNSVRREIWAVDRNVALTNTGSLEEFLMRFSYAEPRFALVLLGIFASVALLLVAVGVYSVTAYTVSRQTQESGIRMALGARRIDVLGMIITMGLRLVAVGVAIGLAASFGATRVIRSQLWGISPHDPITLGGVVGVMAVAGFAACLFRARRATRVDPMVALRYE
jgi:putative ABC transport system permease protein